MENQTFIYIFLSLVSLTTGLFYFKNKGKSLSIFLFISLLIPTSDQFMFLTSFKGVYFYDYYFLTLIIYYVLNLNYLQLKEAIYKYKIYLILILGFLLYQISSIAANSIPIDKYLLKDFRPFILITSLLIFTDLLKNNILKIDKILNILGYVFIFKLIFFIILFCINPFEDPFYQKYLYRYRDGTTIVAALFLIVSLFKKEVLLKIISNNKLNTLVLLALALLLISNLRILLPALLFSYLFIHRTSTQKFIRKIILSLIFIGSFIGYTYIIPKIQFDLHGKERIILRIKNLEHRKLSKARINKEKAILKTGYVPIRYNRLFSKFQYQLEKRFEPAINDLYNMSKYEFLLGKGMGTTFKIPSFNYRGLDSRLNKIDSSYITLYIKYGLLGLVLMILLLIKIISNNIRERELKVSIISFYIIYISVNSIFYQPGTIIHLMFLNILMCSIYNAKLSITKI
tara:strand:+ start:104 stop:1474 length:1371 start_codon:yes stop_codon:yes gene_type:complete